MTVTILYAGVGGAGRTTSVRALCPLHPEEPWSAWIARIAGGVSVSQRELRIVLPHFRNLSVPSLHDAVDDPDPTVSEIAMLALDRLPDVQGVMMLVDSRAPRLDATLECFERVRHELSRAGRDPTSLPCVFQLTHRDAASAASIDRLRDMLERVAPRRHAFVESIPSAGHGVTPAVDTLLELVDGRDRDMLGGPRRPAPSSATAMFAPFESLLTIDGMFRERLEVHAVDHVVRFEGEIGVARGWPATFEGSTSGAPGGYRVEIVKRHVERRDTGWSPVLEPTTVAARLRATGTTSVEHRELVATRTSTMFVIVGPARRVEAVTQHTFGTLTTYEAAARDGFAEEDGMVIFNVGTVNETHVAAGYDAERRVVEVVIYGDDAAALLRGDPAP